MKFGGHTRKVFVGVGAEVKVEGREALLHHSPHGLAEIGNDLHQLLSGKAARGDVAKIDLQQRLVFRIGQVVVDAEIGQVKKHIAHPRILPVEQAQLTGVGVEEKILVQQIVMTQAGGEGFLEKSGLDLGQACPKPGVVLRKGCDAPLPRNSIVVFDDAEGRKISGDGWQGVNIAKQLGHAAQIFPAGGFRRARWVGPQ